MWFPQVQSITDVIKNITKNGRIICFWHLQLLNNENKQHTNFDRNLNNSIQTAKIKGNGSIRKLAYKERNRKCTKWQLTRRFTDRGRHWNMEQNFLQYNATNGAVTEYITGPKSKSTPTIWVGVSPLWIQKNEKSKIFEISESHLHGESLWWPPNLALDNHTPQFYHSLFASQVFPDFKNKKHVNGQICVTYKNKNKTD